MLTYDDFSRKCHIVFKMIFAFLKVFKFFRTFQIASQQQFSIQKSKVEEISPPPPVSDHEIKIRRWE